MKTPQQTYPKLAKILNIDELYLKREDLHKYGSHKGRSIPLMIKQYVRNGVRNFVISSSGNAALAAILAAQQHNKNNREKQISLTVFVGQHIDPKKLNRLQKIIQDNAISIEQVERPKQQAFQMDKNGQATFLRQSTDELALEGYMEMAKELSRIPNLAAIFVPTSSGTTAQALAQSFIDLNIDVQVHIVQTTAHHPIASVFDTDFVKTDTSVAGAIVDNVAHRKDPLVEAIKQTSGSGWIVGDSAITKAQELIKEQLNISVSQNGVLGIAGLQKALSSGWKKDGAIVCLVCGQ